MDDAKQRLTAQIREDVAQERVRQDQKWGFPQGSKTSEDTQLFVKDGVFYRPHTLPEWFCFIGEELGEAMQAYNNNPTQENFLEVRRELTQTAALCEAMILHMEMGLVQV